MKIGETIKILRKNKGLKQHELAKKIGLTASYLSQIEKGKKDPSAILLKKISKAINIPVPFILFKSLGIDDIKKDRQQAFIATKPIVEAMLEKLF